MPPDATNVSQSQRTEPREAEVSAPRRLSLTTSERFGRRVLLSRVTLIKFTAKVKDRLIAAAAGVAVVVLTPLLGLIYKSLDETLRAGEPF